MSLPRFLAVAKNVISYQVPRRALSTSASVSVSRWIDDDLGAAYDDPCDSDYESDLLYSTPIMLSDEQKYW